MFTGLVQHVGVVQQVTPTEAGVRLTIDLRQRWGKAEKPGWGHVASNGDSIAVSGCCLTVASGSECAKGIVCFDAVAQTLAMTTLGSLALGSRVNLEHAVRADTLMGGHFVQGHIDGVAVVSRVQDDPADWRVEFDLGPELMRCVVPQGSIAVDGVSLTVARVGEGGFGVALIPTTLDLTTLSELRVGSRCNIETDMIARQVAHLMSQYAPSAVIR